MPDTSLDWKAQRYTSFGLSPGSHHRTPSCALESTNEDVLTAIMAAAHTPPDLGSFIRASPIFYQCFLAEKRSILLSIASRELGPALGDAVVLAQTERLDWYSDDYYDHVADIVKEYGRRLTLDQPRTWKVDAATLVRVIQLNRATRFFVDLYASTRLYILKGIDPASATPLSLHERTRLSLALTRLQILTRLYPSWNTPGLAHKNEELVFEKFFSLFPPWELEQLTEANGAVLNACRALMECEAADPLGPRTRDARGGKRRGYFDKFYWNLEAFRRKILAASVEDGRLVERMRVWLCEGQNRGMSGTIVTPLDGSHLYRRQPTLPLPTREELCGQRYLAGASDAMADAPYAWRDALEGRDWPVWGLDLLQNPPPPEDRPNDDGRGAKGRLERWRWMGLVFWDQSRVEAVKRTATFSGYQTGWLVRLRASGT